MGVPRAMPQTLEAAHKPAVVGKLKGPRSAHGNAPDALSALESAAADLVITAKTFKAAGAPAQPKAFLSPPPAAS
jgi:hypothetical protein